MGKRILTPFGMVVLIMLLTAQSALPGDEPQTSAPQPVAAVAAPSRTAAPADPEVLSAYVRPLTPITVGHNDANPVWSPDGQLLAFERAEGDRRQIIVAQRNGTIARTIACEAPAPENSMNFFFAGVSQSISYNSGLSWSPDGRSLVFMSNAGSGNYDLYLLPELGAPNPLRLTRDEQRDSHPHWSPKGAELLFVSGRGGKADVYCMQLPGGTLTRLTREAKMCLYPRWSPDGRRVALIYGDNENHDIYLIDDPHHPVESLRALTGWPYDDLRPVWSPDGCWIAFYSNYNAAGDPKQWSLLVVPADAALPLGPEDLTAAVVAYPVVPDVEQGAAWMPDSRRLAYVKDDPQAFNPIYLVDSQTRGSVLVRTATRMNHDLSCAPDGTLAFRAQVEQWDHIHLAVLAPAPLQDAEAP